MKRLKELRKDANLTQVEVARMLNIHYNTYCKYEIGRVEPNNEMLVKMANLFHTTTDYLLEREVYNLNLLALTDKKVTIINSIVDMKEEEIDQLEQIIKVVKSK